MRSGRYILRAVAFGIISVVIAGLVHADAAPIKSNPQRSAEIQKRSAEWMAITAEAEKLLRQGKVDAAIEKYTLILEQRKKLELDLMVQQLALADAYEKAKQLDKATQLHLEAIKGREAQGGDDDPTLIFPLQSYAAYLKRIKKPTDAARQTQRVAYIEKQRNQPPKELVELRKRKDLKNAELSTKAVEIGDTYMNRDQEQRGIMAFTQAIAWNAANSDAYAGRGEAYRRLEQDTRAKADLDKAIQLNDLNARARFQRALYYEGLKKWDLAVADFDKAVAANPQDWDVIGWRAKLFQNNNKFDKAIADYDRVLQLDPNATWALMQRGLCFEEKKMYDRAAADFTRLAELFPDNSDYKEAKTRVETKAKTGK